MIDQATLLTYTLIVLGFVFIPGPATLLTAARASTSGTKVGLATAFGIAVGDLAHTFFAVFGISALILASAFAFTLIKYLGAAYLVYLGLKAIFGKSKLEIGGGKIQMGVTQAFNQAIVAEILNPKTALFFLAFLPQFVKPENGSIVAQLLLLSVILIVLGLVSNLVFVFAATGLGNFFRKNPNVVKWQNKVLGSIFCALGFSLALQSK